MKYHSIPARRLAASSAFTLVELLVVVGILVLVTASTLLIVDRNDDQQRHEKTRQAYTELSAALFGPSQTTNFNGSLVIAGYLADTGKVPSNLGELLVKPTTMVNWQPVLAANPSGLYHGWRGPYISQQDDTVLRDAWGHEWLYTSPATTAANMVLGSKGRDGAIGGTETYEKDYPLSTTLTSGFYTLTNVPIPRRRVKRSTTGPLTLHIGVLHAGLTTAILSQNFTGPDHSTLLRQVTTNASGAQVTTLATLVFDSTSSGGSSSSSGSGSSEDTSIKTIPANLTYNLNYARQLQLVLYKADKNGTTLLDKMYAVDPAIFSYLPRVSTVGQEAASSTATSDIWIIP